MIQRRPFKEFLREPGTQHGISTVLVLIGHYFGIPQDITLSLVGVISAVAIARRG